MIGASYPGLLTYVLEMPASGWLLSDAIVRSGPFMEPVLSEEGIQRST